MEDAMDAITLTDNLTSPPMSASWLHEGLRMAGEVSLDRDHSDYVLVRDTIQFISERWRDQPELETIAAAWVPMPATCIACSLAGPA
jgi:hypothetical protein